GGLLTLDLLQDRSGRDEGPTTAFGGRAHIFATDPLEPTRPGIDALLALKGTVGLPAVQRDGSALSQFAAIGTNDSPDTVRPAGIIAVLIGLLSDPREPVMPAALQGRIALYGDF